MKKNIKVGLYNPYLDILGGGEKHILSIMEVFNQNGAEVTIFWNKNLTSKIKKRFTLEGLKTIRWLPSLQNLSFWQILKILKAFDYFFYVTDGSYFFSTAKKNFVFCMVPDKKLYHLNLLNRLKLWNFKFLSNSPFTTKWLIKWGINSLTIPPYIDNQFFFNHKIKKERIILSVGRFFQYLHSKNQEKIIISYKKIKQKYSLFKKFKLILAGGLKKEDKYYFNRLKDLAKNDPLIIFKPNISFTQLQQLYRLSTFFWHFTGYGQDEKKHPETVEHLGISPLEAMASGCLVFCYNAGGPKEFIQDSKNGFLFSDENELFIKNLIILKNPYLQKKIINNAQNFVKTFFSYSVFKERVEKNIL